MARRRLWGKQSVAAPSAQRKLGEILEWLVEFLGLEIFRILSAAKTCSELLDAKQCNLWTRVLKNDICFNRFAFPDAMCRALGGRLPSELHTLRVHNGICFPRRASKRSIASSWRSVVDWVRPNMKVLDMAFSDGIYLASIKKLFRNLPLSLEYLRLDFQNSESLRPLGRDLEQLANRVAQMSNLRGLRLYLHDKEHWNSVQYLLQRIPSEVCDLSLSMDLRCLNTAALYDTFSSKMASLSQLRVLELYFVGSARVRLDPSRALAGLCAGKLKTLKVEFVMAAFPRHYLEVFFQMLCEKQAELEHLTFMLDRCRFEVTPHLTLPRGLRCCHFHVLSAEGLDALPLTFPPSLSSLELEWFDCHWPIESFSALVRQLPPKLQNLHLGIDWCTMQSVQTEATFPGSLRQLAFHALNMPMLEQDGWQHLIVKNVANAMRSCFALQCFNVFVGEKGPYSCYLEDTDEIRRWAQSHLGTGLN